MMISRFAASIVLAMLLPATSAVAQTVAEQLQKAIYNQETVGDLDSAIQIYRQIISSNPTQRAVAAQAQFRLSQALLQKGDLNGASQEFQTLALNYSDGFRRSTLHRYPRVINCDPFIHGRIASRS